MRHFNLLKLLPKLLTFVIFGLHLLPHQAFAQLAAPYYRLILRPSTSQTGNIYGGGGTGTGMGLYYQHYYVGQVFDLQFQMVMNGIPATSGDIVFQIPENYLNCSVVNGSIMEAYNSQIATVNQAGNNYTEFRITGNMTTAGQSFSGTGILASLHCTVLQPLEPQLATANPLPLNLVFNSLGDTYDCNIGTNDAGASSAINGDVLKSVESGWAYLWPDNGKPYVDAPSPANAATNVSVTTRPTVWFRDRNPTSGGEVGVNTGTLVSQYKITSASTYATATNSWSSCSGLFAGFSTQCLGTVTPASIGGSRYFSYATPYEFCYHSGRDRAAANQTPYVAGPNVMDQTCYTFTTEPDTTKPTTVSYGPTVSAPITTHPFFRIQDVKTTSPLVTGTGLDISTMQFTITGFRDVNLPLNLTLTCADPGMTCTPVGNQLENGRYYAYDVQFNPATAVTPFQFAQDVTITLTVSHAQDFASPAPNIMTPFSWSFQTQDIDPPYLVNILPLPNEFYQDASISANLISFDLNDDGVGVDLDTVQIRLSTFLPDGTPYDVVFDLATGNFNFTGDASSYQINFDPGFDLKTHPYPIGITINGADFSGNALVPEFLYSLALSSQSCPTCPTCPPIPTPTPTPIPTPPPAATPSCPLASSYPVATNCPACPVSNCSGKNYESCSSCCPSVTCPPPQIIYRNVSNPIYYVPDENDNCVPQGDVIDEEATTTAIAAHDNLDQSTVCLASKSGGCWAICRWGWCCWIPWILLCLMTIVAWIFGLRSYEFQRLLEKRKRAQKEQDDLGSALDVVEID